MKNIFSLLIFAFLLLTFELVSAQNVGIGTNTPNPSAKLDITSTNSGFLPPRLTTAQRDSINNPAEGLQIFNTSTKCLQLYAYGYWQDMFCASERAAAIIDSELVTTNTIASFKSYHFNPGSIDLISDDVIISGVVIANDKSGNFNQQLFIQDSTGAIQVLLNKTNLYESFPIGRKIYIKCRGMALSDYHGVMQLGMLAYVSGVPSFQGVLGNMISRHVYGGSFHNPFNIYSVNNLNSLGTSMSDFYANNLIQISDYEFAATDTASTYSDTSAYKSTTNRNVQNCTGLKSLIRTSGYANFAGVHVPMGNGSLTAIYNFYGTTQQLMIRDTSDVQMNDSRCDAPKIEVSPSSFSDLTYQVGEASILEETFTISGYRLNSSIEIIAPQSFEISLSSGSGFSNSITLNRFSSLSNIPVYVRLKPDLPLGTYHEFITLSSTGAVSKFVSCSGTVTSTISSPVINVVSSLSLFNYLNTSIGPSPIQVITVSGVYLISDIMITAPSNYEISTNPDSGFVNSVNLSANSGLLAGTMIYIRLVAGLPMGIYTGAINITSSMANTRTVVCNGSVTEAPAGYITIAGLRALFNGTNLKLTGPKVISGTVTSDVSNGNITPGTLIIQDATAAIQIYFGGTITYALGDSIVLNIENDSLINFKSSLELKCPAGTILPTPLATGRVVVPITKTIAEINNSLSQPLGSSSNLEFMLIQIQNATVASGTFSGNKNLIDGTGTITLYTASAASFSASFTPSGARNWTCQPKLYLTTKEVLLRNLNDVQ